MRFNPFTVVVAAWSAMLMVFAIQINAEIVPLTDATFEHQTQASTGGTTGSWLVLFGSSTCPPCNELKPILEELSQDEAAYENGIVIGSVDVTTSPDTALRFGIQSIPTLIYLHKKQLYRFPSDLERNAESLREFVLEGHYDKVPAEAIPDPPTALDQLKDVFAKLEDGGLLLYAFAGMGVLLLGTIGVLISVLLKGGSKNKKD